MADLALDLVYKFIKEKYNKSDKWIMGWLKEYKKLNVDERSNIVYNIVGKYLYVQNPVSMKTFLNDPYYLGGLYTNIYQIWQNMLYEIYPAPFCKRYNEVVLSCGIRSGKSVVSTLSTLYEIYMMSIMRDPAKHLAGNASTQLAVCLLSYDNRNAVMLAEKLFQGLTQSPYFQEVYKKKFSTSKLTSEGTKISDNLIIKAGSDDAALIGSELCIGVMDEANIPVKRIRESDLVEARLGTYHNMHERRRLTFEDKAFKMFGMIWMMSSPTSEGDVIGERIQEIDQNGIKNVLIRDNIATWTAQGKSMDKTFDFFLGSDTKDPCMVEDSGLDISEFDPAQIIKIPDTKEYRTAFSGSNVIKNIQNIAGRRTQSDCALFPSVEKFSKVFKKENDIFRKDILPINLDKKHCLEEFLIDKDYFKHPHRPDCYRYIHLDIASKKDRFGLTSIYSDMIEYKSNEGDILRERKYFIDFCLGITSSNNSPVDILKILDFIKDLKRQGYPIKLVTTDNHQGELARQYISRYKIKTEYLSVEKTIEPYFNLKNAIETEKLEGYKNPFLTKELRGLRIYEFGANGNCKQKVEKGRGFTDDMSDSLAGALFDCSQDKFFKKMEVAMKEVIDKQREVNKIQASLFKHRRKH